MHRKAILWLYVYITAGIFDLMLIANDLWIYRHFSKPLILLSLTVYFIKGSILIKGSFLRKSVCSGLLFFLIGDILLLYPFLYMYGLGAYLMGQICYILAFKLAQKPGFHLPRLYFIKLFVYNSPIYLLSAFLYFMIHIQLNQLKIPVVIYLCALVLMCTIARERFTFTNLSSFWQVYIGAFLYFVSQGIYLLDFFNQNLPGAEFAIMGTYLLAQLLIVMGLRSHFISILNEKLSAPPS